MYFYNNKAITKGNNIIVNPPANKMKCINNPLITPFYYDLTLQPISSTAVPANDDPKMLFPRQLISFKAQSSEICDSTLYL